MEFLESLPIDSQLLSAAALALAVLVGAIILHHLLKRSLRLVLTAARLEVAAMRPINFILRSVIAVFALVVIATLFGFNLGGLWAVFTTVLAMVSIGFVAVWSILSNLLCTLVIVITAPFRVGDEIEFPTEPVKGKVIDINFLFTSLRGEDGAEFRIPNNLFFQRVFKRRRGTDTQELSQQLSKSTPAA